DTAPCPFPRCTRPLPSLRPVGAQGPPRPGTRPRAPPEGRRFAGTLRKAGGNGHAAGRGGAPFRVRCWGAPPARPRISAAAPPLARGAVGRRCPSRGRPRDSLKEAALAQEIRIAFTRFSA